MTFPTFATVGSLETTTHRCRNTTDLRRCSTAQLATPTDTLPNHRFAAVRARVR